MEGLLSNERELLARIIQAEAGNQGETGMRAVASVIDNRRRAQGYGGNTFRDVLLAPGQFSPANSITGYAGGEQGVDLNRLQPSETAYSVADTVMRGEYEDPTGGALNFLNPDISQPSWLSSMQNTVKIGDHLFGTAGSGEGVTGRPGGINMARQPQLVSGTPTVSTRGQAAPQAEEEKVPFFQRPGVGNALDSLAIALQGMTISPNEGLMRLSAGRIADRREAARAGEQQNRTLEALRNMGASDDLIQMAQAGLGREALAEQARRNRGQEPQDPYSSIGKLQADLAAGRISQEQYELELQSRAPSNTSIEVGPDGQLRFAQGPGAQAKPFTEGQSKDNVYVTRAQGALEVLDPVADQLVSAASRAANIDPTGFIRSRIQSPEFQVAQQAGNEFLQAILRKDTGAAITEPEQQLYGQTYLPQPGDSPQVLTEKKAARRRALDAIRAGMSPAQLIAVERGLSQGQQNGAPQAGAGQSGGDGFSVTGVID